MRTRRIAERLSASQRELILLYALGLSEQQAADVAGEPLKTITTRGARLRRFAGVSNTPALVWWALDRGEIPPLKLSGPLGLTPHQSQATELVGQGLTNRQIGEKLYIVESSAKQLVDRTIDVAGAFNRNNLVAMYWSEECYAEFPLSTGW
jgi:DNA-binding CsgD family transcriptional regulator